LVGIADRRGQRQKWLLQGAEFRLYMSHAEATDNPLVSKVLIDIANEERVHAGEFARLLSILTGDEDALLEKGAKEVDEMAAEK
jgi:rubrerythrin